MLCGVGSAAHQPLFKAGYLHYIVRYQPVPALYQVQRCLALAQAAFTPYQNTGSVYIHEFSMEQYAPGQLFLYEAGYLVAHPVGGTVCNEYRHAVVPRLFKQYLRGLVAAGANYAWNMKPHEPLHSVLKLLGRQAVKIVHLRVAYELHPLWREFLIKARKLQAGPAYFWSLEAYAPAARLKGSYLKLAAYFPYAYLYRHTVLRKAIPCRLLCIR